MDELILRILNGLSSEDERKQFTEWLNSGEENREEFRKAEAAWNAIEIVANRNKYDPEKGYQKFMAKIGDSHIKALSLKELLKIPVFRIAVAAMVIITLGLSVFFYSINTAHRPRQIAFFECTTPQGSHTRLALTDGTVVYLNAGSKLTYPDRFEDDTREVTLDGEGYFNVAKDAKHPFIVKTSHLNIRVLGTVFNVKSYPDEGTIETTLISGSVIIEGNKKQGHLTETIELSPHEKATYIKKAGKIMLSDNEKKQLADKSVLDGSVSGIRQEKVIITSKVNTDAVIAWKNNSLLFDNESFESIALKLERRYGVTILFNDEKVKNYRYSGRFDEISIEKALEALNFASPFNYSITNDSIIIGESKH